MAKSKVFIEDNSPLCVIIDGDNIAHGASHSYKRLSYKGKPTAVVFGMPSMIRPIINVIRPAKIIICWDGMKHPKRMELNPKYKMHREKTRDPIARESYLKQKFTAMKFFKLLGVCQAYDPNIEGDDMIYLVNKKMLAKGYNTRIISGDKDMEQLISKYTWVYSRNGNCLMPGLMYEAQRSIEHTQIVDYLCLTGDGSDDIDGYYGIGPVKAINFLNKYKSIEAFLKSKSEFKGIDREKLRTLYKLNKQLIDLEVFNKKYNKGIKATFYKGKFKPKLKEALYIQFCMKYGLKTLITKQFINQFQHESKSKGPGTI